MDSVGVGVDVDLVKNTKQIIILIVMIPVLGVTGSDFGY